MPYSEQKIPILIVNDTKIPASEKKRTSLPNNDMNMPADNQIPSNNHKRGNVLPTIQRRVFFQMPILGKILNSIMLLYFLGV